MLNALAGQLPRSFFRGREAGVASRRTDMAMTAYWHSKRAASANPMLRASAKFFSQNDEDGILLEIIRRTCISAGSFVEIGVGDGLENNTLILLMLGWRGLWLGGESLAFQTSGSTKLAFHKLLVTPHNVEPTMRKGLAELDLDANRLDVLSVDIDSYDRDLVQAILDCGMRPLVFIVEYNAKFPPPIRFAVSGSEPWDGTDYFGCSLQSWWDLMIPAGYKLVACNITGVNAFFVRADHSHLFEDAPMDIHQLYMQCDYNWFLKVGHPTSPKTILRFIE
jgi:hypothetical protein